ncbi:tRNA1(Val) (adenine(37)-N6)-methyltransferase [Afifella sp. IM 167]|uniref:tRNA1(Val) (adenine(37)-N6)-methyltransferase n=1 Tax=Afifella sp. IM 167 TaxID=2033586 RepID=UPI001CCEF6B1|nr:methyltransferase [Afifella sp. IM 167]MBZ8133375.1 methyltransferase [Afifella sp. IM 167]
MQGLAEPATHGFLGDRVALVRPASGHRPGLDAALLQAALAASAKGLAVEFGCGTGAVTLSLTARCAGLSVLGLEADPVAFGEAEAALGLAANAAFAARAGFLECDIMDQDLAGKLAGERRPDVVLANPPFYVESASSVSPDGRRRFAHHAAADPLRGWVAAAAGLLKPAGGLALIHRADRLGEILAALAPRFGAVTVLPFHPHAGEPASRILVVARLAGRAPLKLLPGLVLHEAGGGWTERIDAVLRGRADFSLLAP